ncbi:hypothetical protein HPB51_024111 [Rhipicephalus microplus]|uniref:Peptidase M13 N-terminal domain-containing protein n=1 Tax=Rhipicephalus microplus TaxID=6941 RepID=A0A9J6ED71_RHIMP|nr:hypothetical protein HPB51_024111 [Rhipicephalus microplus]
MGHHKKPGIAHPGSGGLIGSAEAEIEGLVKKSYIQTSHAKHHHHGSGARRPVADGAKKSLANAIPAAMDASEYSSIEAQELQARYDKVAIGSAVAVALVVLLIVFIAVSWYIASRKQVVEPSAMRGYSLVNILGAACITDDCRTAVTMMNSSIDPSANPCDELYKYACGNWHAVDDDGRPLSYEANVRYHYVHAVDRKLVGNATIDRLCNSGDPRAKMGCIYSSCVAFYTKTCVCMSLKGM